MESRKVNIMILGAGKPSVDLIDILSREESVNILAVVDANSTAPGIKLAKKLGISTACDWKKLLPNKGLDQIIDATGEPKVYAALLKDRPANVDIMSGASAKLTCQLLEKKEKVADELREIVSRFFEHSPNIVVITDTKGKIEYVNSNFIQMTGYSSEEIMGTDLRNLCDQSPEEANKMRDTVNSGSEWRGEFRVRKKNGKFYWELATVTPLKDQSDAITHFQKIAVDITARKQAEEALQRDYKTTRRIIENAPFGIFIVSEKGNIDYVNPAMLKISDLSYEKFLHLNVFDLPAAEKTGLLEKIKAGLRGEYFELDSVNYVWDLTGKSYIINFTGIPLEEEGARKVIIVVEDITEQKKAENDLRKANEELKKLDQVKSDFISTVSHEFRSPLTSIREAVSQISDEIKGKLNKQQKDFLSMAMEDIDRLWKIVGNLLDISKIEAGVIELKRTLVDMREVVKNAAYGFQNLFKGKDLVLDYVLPKQDIDVYVDVDKIRRVISNLLANAYKFSNKGGKVTISAKAKEKEVEIAVKDTGRGIAKTNIPKLFDKFTQFGKAPSVGEKGTGLGLAISKGIVQMHGGKIWAESELNKGSTFKFSLPQVNSERIFKEYIDSGIKEAVDKESGLSLIVLAIPDIHKLDKILKGISAKDILIGLEGSVKKVLRRNADVFLKNSGECVILLYGTGRAGAKIVKDRVREAVSRYIDEIQKKHKIKLNVSSAVSVYPEEASTGEELLLKAKVRLKDLYLGPERREHSRMAYNIDVGLAKAKGKLASTQTVNISESGICISSDRYIRIGKESSLVIALPEQFGTIKAKARTKWVKKIEETNEYRLGLQLFGMSNKDKKALKKFLQSIGGQCV